MLVYYIVFLIMGYNYKILIDFLIFVVWIILLECLREVLCMNKVILNFCNKSLNMKLNEFLFCK